MTDPAIQNSILQTLAQWFKAGQRLVLVHGGGPFIANTLTMADVKSEFVDGQRRTSPKAMKYVEMALKGEVNGLIVGQLNTMGIKAVGLSGKDGRTVTAQKRFHITKTDGHERQVDLGRVGEAREVDVALLTLLLDSNYLPVVACIASDEEGNDYNINADNFAGSLAGALNAREFIILTDIDGLLRDVTNPSSIIPKINKKEIDVLIAQGIIKGGMLPKIESCIHALNKGARSVRILNGARPQALKKILNDEATGTLIQNN